MESDQTYTPSSSCPRPPTSHRTDTPADPHDPRAAHSHSSPQLGTSLGGSCAPPSPKLAPSPSISPAPAHAESSAQAAARHQPDMFMPFVSPAPASATPARAPTNPPPSAEYLKYMLREDKDDTSSLVAEAGTPPPPEPHLLTCKPLERVASQMGTPVPPLPTRNLEAEWARHARKPMERIVSQAGYQYYHHHSVALKRARSMSDPPECHRTHHVQSARTAAKYFRGAPRKKMRMWSPKDAAEHAEGDRIMRQIRSRAQDLFVAAAREPPVNMRSLRVLDTNEVLRLPQMRHDLLFDNFGFRPIHSPMTYSNTHYGLLSTLRSQVVHPSPVSETANRYWECIRAEIEIGCRCTRWESSPAGRVKECICGRWKPGMSEAKWWKETRATWPSRLPKLVQTLREILESLMASTTPSVSHFPVAARDPTTPYPTHTHSLVPALFEALDPEFLTVQVRRGTFDVALFQTIGEAMKVHCAPVRDAMVDDMVATATGGNGNPDVVAGLRKCFDCVEVMKLDIANHQVQSLKPMLWQQAEQNEMTTFINYLVAAGRTLESSKTFAWINASSKRVAMATPPRERRHLMGNCACETSTEFVIRSLADGFIDLVFGDWVEAHEVWPPIVPSRRPGSPITGHIFPTKVVVPEVFKMDSCRLKNFHAEMVDIAIAQAILKEFKAQYVQHNAQASEDEVAHQVAQVRESYKHVMTLGTGLARATDCPSDLSLHMAHRVVFAHATCTELRSPADVELVNSLAHEFDQTISQGIRRDADMYAESLASLRRLVHAMLTNVLLLHRVQPESFLYDLRGVDTKPCVRNEPIPTAPRLRVPARRFVTLSEPLTGQGSATSDPRERYHRPAASAAVLEARKLFAAAVADSQVAETALAESLAFDALVHEIRAVVERMVKTADFNLCVFANLYGRKGMLVGSGKMEALPELKRGGGEREA